jgi:hypothetical protein
MALRRWLAPADRTAWIAIEVGACPHRTNDYGRERPGDAKVASDALDAVVHGAHFP